MSGATSAHASSEDPQFEYSTDVPLTLRLTQGTKESSEEAGGDEQRPHAAFETNFLVAIMSPSMNQAQLLFAFIASISPGQSPVLQPTFRYIGMFLGEVASIAVQSHVLEWAVRAVSLSHLGRQVQDQHLIQLSRQMYRQALLTLNAALQDPIDGLSSKTLAATILLSFYEVINCTEKDSWVRHAGGAGHLMRIRGPDRHRRGLGRICFLAYRHSLVIEAFLSRNATFLAVQPWLELSRDVQEAMPDRTPTYDLVDDFHLLTVELPGFTQSAQDANATPAARRKLLAVGQAHRGNLKVLYDRMVATLEEANQEPTEQLSATNDAVFPIVYNFPSLGVGSLLCGYWAVLTIVNHNLARLENELAHPSTSTADMDPSKPARYHLRNTPSNGGGKYLEENLRNSRESCKAAEGLSCSAFLGPLYLIFALRVAYNTFLEGAEKDWVLQRLEEVSAHLGIARALLPVQEERERLAESASASVSINVSAEVSRRASVQSPEVGMASSRLQSPELKRKVTGASSGYEGSESEDLSRRTSVSLQEIERRPSRQEDYAGGTGKGTGTGMGKGKGMLR